MDPKAISDWLSGEVGVLSHVSFWVAVGIVGLLIWRAMEWRYAGIIERLREGRKDDQPTPPQKPERKLSDAEAVAVVLNRVYATLGATVGKEDRLSYDLALADTEHIILAMQRGVGDIVIPELRKDGTPSGVYRMLAYLNFVGPALRADDVAEARRRAAEFVPYLNDQSAQELHEEMGLPHYSYPPN